MVKEVSNYDFVMVLLARVGEISKHGKIMEAEELLNKAVEIADDIVDLNKKIAAFIQISRSYAMLGKKQNARDILDSAEEEIEQLEDQKSLFMRIIIRIEKARLGLIEADKLSEFLESIRKMFRNYIEKTQNREAMRYYIAFIVAVWAPIMINYDVSHVEKVLSNIMNDLKDLREDPYYAELLTLLAEVHVKVRKMEQAMLELKRAVAIYKKSLDMFEDVIKSILDFVKKNFPNKYEEFLREIGI
ncbi:MAG: hypothetical protein Q6363_000810 [Candidatus Njordarchaeota archaeon]